MVLDSNVRQKPQGNVRIAFFSLLLVFCFSSSVDICRRMSSSLREREGEERREEGRREEDGWGNMYKKLG